MQLVGSTGGGWTLKKLKQTPGPISLVTLVSISHKTPP